MIYCYLKQVRIGLCSYLSNVDALRSEWSPAHLLRASLSTENDNDSDDEDDMTDDDSLSDWNLRKCSAAALGKIRESWVRATFAHACFSDLAIILRPYLPLIPYPHSSFCTRRRVSERIPRGSSARFVADFEGDLVPPGMGNQRERNPSAGGHS